MADEQKPTEVVVEDSKVADNSQELIEIPEKNPAPESKQEIKYATVNDLEAIRKQLNGISYLGRQLPEISRKIDSLAQGRQAIPAKPEGEKDEWDKKVETNWKGTVQELAEIRFNELMEKRQREDYFRQTEIQRETSLNQAKQAVINRYPELADPDSDTSIRYTQVMQEHPEWLRNEQGPLLTMYAMEEKMKQEGVLDKTTRQVVDKEAQRRLRVNSTSIPKGNFNPNGGKIVLTREDMEFCEHNGIDPKEYHRNKQLNSQSREGVSVQ